MFHRTLTKKYFYYFVEIFLRYCLVQFSYKIEFTKDLKFMTVLKEIGEGEFLLLQSFHIYLSFRVNPVLNTVTKIDGRMKMYFHTQEKDKLVIWNLSAEISH